jgi:hypothetical protein
MTASCSIGNQGCFALCSTRDFSPRRITTRWTGGFCRRQEQCNGISQPARRSRRCSSRALVTVERAPEMGFGRCIIGAGPTFSPGDLRACTAIPRWRGAVVSPTKRRPMRVAARPWFPGLTANISTTELDVSLGGNRDTISRSSSTVCELAKTRKPARRDSRPNGYQ